MKYRPRPLRNVVHEPVNLLCFTVFDNSLFILQNPVRYLMSFYTLPILRIKL